MGGIAVQSYGIMYPGTVDGIVSSGGGTIVNVDGPDTEGATTITPDNLNFFARHALHSPSRARLDPECSASLATGTRGGSGTGSIRCGNVARGS